MKKSSLIFATFSVALIFASCKKEECHNCHYDGPSGEVELGEKCGEELEKLEASGYTEGSTVYTVHCHEH